MWSWVDEWRRRPGLRLARLRRQGADRLRGARTLEQLVADGLELGEGASVDRGAYLDTGRPWLITIGEQSVISDFAVIMAHDARSKSHVGATRLARVVIGRRVFVAPYATILPGTRVGDDSVIDVRSVVSGEIPPGSFVSGNPGRVIGSVQEMAERVREAAASGPTWPYEGWSGDAGITDERKRAQREAVAEASEGFVHAPASRRNGR